MPRSSRPLPNPSGPDPADTARRAAERPSAPDTEAASVGDQATVDPDEGVSVGDRATVGPAALSVGEQATVDPEAGAGDGATVDHPDGGATTATAPASRTADGLPAVAGYEI